MAFAHKLFRGIPVYLVLACALVVATGGPLASAAEHGSKAAKDEESPLRDWFGNEKVQFFRMPAFHLPVIREGRVIKQVSLSVTVETQGVGKRNMIIERRHTLYDAFLRDLHAVLSIQGTSDRAVNLETIKIRLKHAADRVLGPGIARDILVENAYTRRTD